jgi:hypothetical protein
LLSFHANLAAGYPNADFLRRRVFELDQLTDFVTQRVWSPIIWAGGSRGAVKYRCAFWCVLDYDETLSKAEAIERLGTLPFLLGPTKNDGVEKVSTTGARKPACDRFRVLIPFKHVIWDRDVFEYNMRLAVKQFGSDPLPYDAGRCWQPCKSVEHINNLRDGLDVVTTIPVEETQSYKSEQYKKYTTACGRGAAWPDQVKRFVGGKIQQSERNDMLYKTACFFFENGKTVEWVRELVYTIPEMNGHDKIESTIKSAAKKTGAMYF